MIPQHIFVLVVSVIFLAGCQTAPAKNIPSQESHKDIANAVGQVADALSGQELTPEQRKKLVRDIQKDKDAQSALRSISGAMDVKQTGIKYCPVDGKRYSPDMQVCPAHKVKLEELVD